MINRLNKSATTEVVESSLKASMTTLPNDPGQPCVPSSFLFSFFLVMTLRSAPIQVISAQAISRIRDVVEHAC